MLVLAAGLAGCSSQEEDPGSLPRLESAAPSAASAPTPPAEAAEEDADGASAFARHYVALIADAYARGTTDDLRAASAPGCEGCDAIIRAADEVAALGEKRVGGGYTVEEVASPPVQNGEVVVLLSYTRSAARFVDESGSVVATTAPVPRTSAQLMLIRQGNSWLVQAYQVVDE